MTHCIVATLPDLNASTNTLHVAGPTFNKFVHNHGILK